MKRRATIPLSALGGVAVAGAAALGWAAGVEVRSFRLRRVQVPVLAAGSRPLRVLHLSDLHMTPGQRRKREWVRALAGLEPDLVVNTGDNLAHRESVPAVLDALGPLLESPGAFVMGSNDYYEPTFKNPARYLFSVGEVRLSKRRLPAEDLREGMVSAGWLDLDNARERIKIDHREIELVGTDDPHIRQDRYFEVAGPADPSADLALAVTHAPYRRVLDPMTADGFGLILAGHTHGGQLCVPGVGALVTNCDLPPRRAKGVSEHAYAGKRSLLHVSAGLGTSPYAPVRFACPPEATLLTLVEKRVGATFGLG
ncbi:MAG: metallophosphoesterase [Actinomycetes bacterium]